MLGRRSELGIHLSVHVFDCIAAASNLKSVMNKNDIICALSCLNDKMRERGAVGELCLFGGAVMVLVYNSRLSTKDVDALFEPSGVIRDCAAKVAEELCLPDDWLNDGVKGFLADKTSLRQHAELPQYDSLRIIAPTAEYLLAMKCLASRIGADNTDYEDAKTLVKIIGCVNALQVLQLVEEYFPPEMIPVRTQYFIEELFDE